MKSSAIRMFAAVVITACFAVSAFAGANYGSVRHNDEVFPFATDTYQIVFSGGDLARIGVIGDGSTNLSLYVYDDDGNPIVSDRDSDDDKLVQWTPRRTGQFTVKIVNRGPVENDYVLLTN
jgi:hypothetical protein